VRGPNVVDRYWPDQPACDAQGWFHTGDLASRAADGSYTVVGRSRDLIISGGENIHPLEIEAALGEHPAVAECAAFGLADAQWGEAVAVAVVLHAGAQLSHDALREHLAGRLARFKLPRRVFFVQALPKTALGKLQRQALASMAASGSGIPGQARHGDSAS
jgi:fatty-acyl-CoA synthase